MKFTSQICTNKEQSERLLKNRLMEIGNFTNIGFVNIDNIYDTCVRMLMRQVKAGLVNKEYLK